jgi:signal transduction histidine kinase
MAYRSLKRALGETTLEKKCRRWFGLALFVLIATSFWMAGTVTDRQVMRSNRLLGQELVGLALYEKHGGFYWEPGAEKPQKLTNSQLRAVEDFRKDFRNKQFSWSAILPDLPAPAGEEDQHIDPPEDTKEWEYYDEWMARAETLHTEEDVASVERKGLFHERSIEEEDGERKYRYYQPVFAKSEHCINCHRMWGGRLPNQNLEVGDLMAIMRIEFDEAPTIDAQWQNRAILLTAAVITAVLAMFALYIIVRFVIVKPLKHLRDVSNAVRRGDVNQRAEIQTGDEFEELAAAFNRMLRQLLSQQDKLQDVNATLDKKIDELAQANMRLFEMNRLKSDFLSTVSHELRTPLNSIIGFSDVLAELATLDEKHRRYARNVQKSGRVLLEMINDILDLAKIESGRSEARPTEFRIDSVVSAVCDFARPLSEKKNIDLSCEIQPNLPPAEQDQGKVQQILNNLLSNAIKFTPQGGRIVVSVERDHWGDLLLSVADTGVGIGQEEQKLIFEKFRQGTNALPGGDAMTREYSGTGLGLSIVKELCRLLGGDVSVESVIGMGSTFTVRLPWKLVRGPRLDSELSEELDDLARRQPVSFACPDTPEPVAGTAALR